MSLNTELASRFKTMGVVLQLLGESGFKVNANLKVADVLSELAQDVSTIEDLTSIDGIGKGLAPNDFDVAKSAQPFVEALAEMKNSR